MREFIKAVNSYSWAMSLFGLKQLQNMLTPSQGESKGPATKAMENVTHCTRREFGPTLDSTFKTGDSLQRWMTDITLFMTFPLLMLLDQGSSTANGRSTDASERSEPTSDARRRADEQTAVSQEPQVVVTGRKT